MGYTIIYEIFKDNGVGEEAGVPIITEAQRRNNKFQELYQKKWILQNKKEATMFRVKIITGLLPGSLFHRSNNSR